MKFKGGWIHLDSFKRFKGKYLNDIKNELTKTDKKVNELKSIDKFELFQLNHSEIQSMKRVFQNVVIDLVKEVNNSDKESYKDLKVIVPPEFLEGLKSGEFDFMRAKTGEILPSIVDSKNKLLKQIRLEEIEITPEDLDTVEELNSKILNQKLDAISVSLDNIMEVAEEINKGLQNDRYGKVVGAVRSIKQSYLETDKENRRQLQNFSQVMLNESLAVLEKEVEDGVKYFSDWDNRNVFLDLYPAFHIDRKFNKLMDDYLFFTTGKSTLIELKIEQKVTDKSLHFITGELDKIDHLIKEADIRNWLPPRSEDNRWQHDLLNNLDYRNKRMVVGIDIDVFLEEGGTKAND